MVFVFHYLHVEAIMHGVSLLLKEKKLVLNALELKQFEGRCTNFNALFEEQIVLQSASDP